MKHTMLDLETMGSTPGSALVSIGACEFDSQTGEIGRQFYRTIYLDTNEAYGLRCEADTVMWWLMQSEKSRAALGVDPQNLSRALSDFSAWFDRESLLWAWGADFDPPVLAAAYKAVGFSMPWKFRNVRCARTLCAFMGVERDKSMGVPHRAIDDCLMQAKAVSEAYRKFNELVGG